MKRRALKQSLNSSHNRPELLYNEEIITMKYDTF